MNQQKSLIRIAELLSRFKIETAILNSNAQLDINIVAEDILIPILNIAYKCDLKNAEYSESDTKFPALDLLDKTNKIAFQITSTADIKKARKTIEGIVKNSFHTQFDNFYIYIITQKQKSYDKTVFEAATEGLFSFTEKNVLDETDLYQKVAALPFDDILKVEKLLEKQFSDIGKDEAKIQNQLTAIIEKTKLKHDEEFLIEELEAAFKIRKVWFEKKLFFEKKLVLVSDANQEFSLYAHIAEINEKIENYNNQISELLIQKEH